MEKMQIPDCRGYVSREDIFRHEDYGFEKNIYKMITSGDTEGLERNRLQYAGCGGESGGAGSGKKGVLSNDPLRNERYHMIIYTANVARSCIEAGMPQEQAFTLSDMYIRQADKCSDIHKIRQLGDRMAADYCEQMRILKDKAAYSPAVKRVIEYICDNLHNRITVEELSVQAGFNRSYLSLVFKKETGLTIQDYITEKRIDTAKNMLRLTDYSYSQIAAALSFSTQSYFCRQFKSSTGYTPKEYRLKYSDI